MLECLSLYTDVYIYVYNYPIYKMYMMHVDLHGVDFRDVCECKFTCKSLRATYRVQRSAVF